MLHVATLHKQRRASHHRETLLYRALCSAFAYRPNVRRLPVLLLPEPVLELDDPRVGAETPPLFELRPRPADVERLEELEPLGRPKLRP